MGSDRSSNLLGDDSFLAGAIFMSNRATKMECFSRKLFGSPSVQANFVKKIKIGMVLFLFEYEERKLYGVFEATSDGAMNIVPMAFSSSGKLFSAQVCFRIVWRCPPLTEAEFYDAIKENYYAPNKFHFHLSGSQVYKLLQLFDPQQQCSRGREFITESRHPWKNGGKKYPNFRSGEHQPKEESNMDLNMYSDLPGTDLDHLMHHKRSLQNVDDANVSMEAALHPTFSPLEQPELPDAVNSVSRGVHTFRRNIHVSPEGDSFYQPVPVPGLHLKTFSVNSGMNSATVKDLAYSVGSLDSHPSSRYQYYHSHPGEDMLSMSSVYQNVRVSSNLQDVSFPVYKSSCSLPAVASKDTRERVSINNVQDSISKNFQNRVSIPNLQNPSHSSSSRFNDHYVPNIFSPNQQNYTKLHLDVAKSVHSPARIGLLGYGHCATTSQFDDNSRGPRYFHLEPHEIIPSSEYEPNNLEIIESSFCSSPEKASLPILYSSDRSEYQEEDSSYPHLNEDDEYFPAAISSKFHSDSQGRTSVFLRLSGLQKAPAKKFEKYNPKMDVSFHELIGRLSSRQKYWCRMTEVPSFKKPTKIKVPDFKKMKFPPALKNVNEASDQFVMLDDDEELENMGQFASQPTVLCNREQSCSQEVTDGTILPFLNFKRRSEAQMRACGTEPSNSVELREDEVSLVKCKRRKLLRPSFGEEDASNRVYEIQNVLEETQDLFIKENDGDSNGSVDTAMGIGNETHADARNSCGSSGVSQEHLIKKIQVTLSEHVGNVRPEPASQSDVANQMELSCEGTILIKGKSKFQNMQESSQNLHGGSLLVVDGNNSGGDRCNADGGKEVDMVCSQAPHNDNAKTDTTDVASRGQCKFQNVESSSEHFHGGSLFIKVGDIKGVEHGDTSHITASGSERRQKAKYSRECRSCSCYSEPFSKGHACQTSASAAQDIEAGEQSSNQCRSHGEATENNKEENISERLHVAECDCKNTKDPQRSMSNTQEQTPSMKMDSMESDSEITIDSQSDMSRTAVGVGRQLSFTTYILYSAEGSRDIREKVGAERDQGFDNSAGTTAQFCGKRPLHEVVDNEMKTSHHHLLCATEDMRTTGSLSKPCTVQTGKLTANTEDHLISGRLLVEVIDKDKKKSSCSLVKAAESLASFEIFCNSDVGSSETAESTTPQGNNEIRIPEKLDSSYTKASHRIPETIGSLQEPSGLPTGLGNHHLPKSLQHTMGDGA